VPGRSGACSWRAGCVRRGTLATVLPVPPTTAVLRLEGHESRALAKLGHGAAVAATLLELRSRDRAWLGAASSSHLKPLFRFRETPNRTSNLVNAILTTHPGYFFVTRCVLTPERPDAIAFLHHGSQGGVKLTTPVQFVHVNTYSPMKDLSTSESHLRILVSIPPTIQDTQISSWRNLQLSKQIPGLLHPTSTS
jgi:hypothetical protein